MPEAEAALESDEQVQVEAGDWLVFRPANTEPTTGLILYPGGLVPPAAYAPLAHELAANGYLVVIVPMPLNLAVTAPGRADEVIAAFPEIETWAIAGHSLGGAMAAQFVYDNPGAVDGLIMLAAYPPNSAELRDRDIPVLSIFATLDGLSTPADIELAAPLLPADTLYAPVHGGNHSQFGYYADGQQSGDNPPNIAHWGQQQVILQAILNFLPTLSDSRPE